MENFGKNFQDYIGIGEWRLNSSVADQGLS